MPSKNKNILYICTRLWFESSVFFRYSKNTLVFRNIEVSNTLRCLALVKSVVLYVENYTMFEVYKKEGWTSFSNHEVLVR